MDKGTKMLRAFSWTLSIVTLFVMMIVVGLVSLIVGDWIVIKTGNDLMAWIAGFFVFFGFLCSIGTGIGTWIWLRGPTLYQHESQDNMDHILADISSAERD